LEKLDEVWQLNYYYYYYIIFRIILFSKLLYYCYKTWQRSSEKYPLNQHYKEKKKVMLYSTFLFNNYLTILTWQTQLTFTFFFLQRLIQWLFWTVRSALWDNCVIEMRYIILLKNKRVLWFTNTMVHIPF
jgi:hypothetical protein